MNDLVIKGQRVYIVPEDSRNRPYEATVVSVGPKYITVGPPNFRFDAKATKFPIHSVEDYSDWNPRLNMYPSRNYYILSVNNEHKRKVYTLEISDMIKWIDDVDALEKIHDFIKQLKTN